MCLWWAGIRLKRLGAARASNVRRTLPLPFLHTVGATGLPVVARLTGNLPFLSAAARSL